MVEFDSFRKKINHKDVQRLCDSFEKDIALMVVKQNIARNCLRDENYQYHSITQLNDYTVQQQ